MRLISFHLSDSVLLSKRCHEVIMPVHEVVRQLNRQGGCRKPFPKKLVGEWGMAKPFKMDLFSLSHSARDGGCRKPFPNILGRDASENRREIVPRHGRVTGGPGSANCDKRMK